MDASAMEPSYRVFDQRRQAALTSAQTAVEHQPFRPNAQLAYAAALHDLGRFAEAEATLRRAMQMGEDGADIWLNLGLSLQCQLSYDPAARAFAEAVRRDPANRAAHLAFADLMWMRTGDLAISVQTLDAAMRAGPTPAITTALAKVLVRGGAASTALSMLSQALSHAPGDLGLRMSAVQAARAAGDPARAMHEASEALRIAPRAKPARMQFIEALISVGRHQEAGPMLGDMLEEDPCDQAAIALLSLILRIEGAPSYEKINDYSRLVRTYKVQPPNGWVDLASFLAALRQRLDLMHDTASRSLGQSHRGGTKTWQDITTSTDPVLVAALRAFEDPIAAYIDALGPGVDFLRSRRAAAYKISSAWSVRLSTGGHHIDHVHPEGWISAVFYVETPPEKPTGRDGWLKLGQPGLNTSFELAEELFVRPRPGLLVLFPSYIWHGTAPFFDEGRRITLAFDVIPSGATLTKGHPRHALQLAMAN